MNLDENDFNAQDARADDGLCLLCGLEPVDRQENPDSEICLACRRKHLRYPFPKWLIAVVVALICVLVFAYSTFGESLSDYRSLKAANAGYDSKNFLTAKREYLKLLDRHANSLYIGVKFVESCMASGDYDSAYNAIERYFVGKDVDQYTYDKISEAQKTIDSMSIASEKMTAAIGNETDNAKIVEKLKALVGKNDDGAQDSMILAYAAVYQMEMEDIKTARATMETAYSTWPKNAWILEYLATLRRRDDDRPGAMEAVEKGIAANNECVWAYRQRAALGMLDGKYASALEDARRAYGIDKEYLWVAETLAIACHFNGLTDERDAVMGQIVPNPNTDIPSLEALFDGTITLEEYYSK
jgi:tetratricopeptide (TPR) repeat protein